MPQITVYTTAACPYCRQIFFDDIHIGDCDELHELDRDGKFDELLDGGVQ
jgi:glutaredoxin